MKNYINFPYTRLGNNVAERALKLGVIGRKNWLFVGNEGGGEAAATIYSLAQTCRALGINPHMTTSRMCYAKSKDNRLTSFRNFFLIIGKSDSLSFYARWARFTLTK